MGVNEVMGEKGHKHPSSPVLRNGPLSEMKFCCLFIGRSL